MSTKILNCRQARRAEILVGYDFFLSTPPGSKTPADGPSQCPYCTEDIDILTGTLIPAKALRLLADPCRVDKPTSRQSPFGHYGVSRTSNCYRAIIISPVWQHMSKTTSQPAIFVPESSLCHKKHGELSSSFLEGYLMWFVVDLPLSKGYDLILVSPADWTHESYCRALLQLPAS